MNLEIDNDNIEKSFDRIAQDILLNKSLYVNDIELRFTEIEFYYFHKDNHPDNYTHQHKRNESEWRFHNQGFDITFDGNNDISDGGILIRGISIKDEYINGPRNVLKKIFECFGKVTERNSLMIRTSPGNSKEIIKTFRHLPNVDDGSGYLKKQYRYLVELEKLDIPKSEKKLIKEDLNII